MSQSERKDVLPKTNENKRDERDLRGGGDKTSDLDTSLLLLKNSKKGSEWMWYSL